MTLLRRKLPSVAIGCVRQDHVSTPPPFRRVLARPSAIACTARQRFLNGHDVLEPSLRLLLQTAYDDFFDVSRHIRLMPAGRDELSRKVGGHNLHGGWL